MFINIHSHSLKTAEGVFTPRSFGIHPWEASATCDAALRERTLAQLNSPAVSLVGECGLDKCKGPSLQIQLPVFEAQLLLAEQVQKPVIVHCVHATPELMALRRARHWTMPWIIHGFGGSAQLADELWRVGVWCSFGTALTDPRRTKLRTSLQHLGADRIFLETDNSPMDIRQVYATAALLLGLTVDTLCSAIEHNYQIITAQGKNTNTASNP